MPSLPQSSSARWSTGDCWVKSSSCARALDAKYGFESIIGHLREAHARARPASRAAQSGTTILIRGETGTGKELFAKAIHRNSSRKECFIRHDQLRRHPWAIFSNPSSSATARAHSRAPGPTTPGKVETADGGALFLDEIGELPLELQSRSAAPHPGGADRQGGAADAAAGQEIDIRIIAATHRNLHAMIEDGTFRRDLYYRLAVITLELPPLPRGRTTSRSWPRISSVKDPKPGSIARI